MTINICCCCFCCSYHEMSDGEYDSDGNIDKVLFGLITKSRTNKQEKTVVCILD